MVVVTIVFVVEAPRGGARTWTGMSVGDTRLATCWFLTSLAVRVADGPCLASMEVTILAEWRAADVHVLPITAGAEAGTPCCVVAAALSMVSLRVAFVSFIEVFPADGRAALSSTAA